MLNEEQVMQLMRQLAASLETNQVLKLNLQEELLENRGAREKLAANMIALADIVTDLKLTVYGNGTRDSLDVSLTRLRNDLNSAISRLRRIEQSIARKQRLKLNADLTRSERLWELFVENSGTVFLGLGVILWEVYKAITGK